jgi:hypothetical protein
MQSWLPMHSALLAHFPPSCGAAAGGGCPYCGGAGPGDGYGAIPCALATVVANRARAASLDDGLMRFLFMIFGGGVTQKHSYDGTHACRPL